MPEVCRREARWKLGFEAKFSYGEQSAAHREENDLQEILTLSLLCLCRHVAMASVVILRIPMA